MAEVGRICGIVRYPIKSMAGAPAESAALGWHGLDGDRRLALRRVGDASGFPWLTASRLPELIRYEPVGTDERAGEPLPTHVRTPGGALLALGGAELSAEVGARLGAEVELMRLKHGIFDEAPISLISLATIAQIAREAGVEPDQRRFRANLIVDTGDAEPFAEDAWVGRSLAFGDGEHGPAVAVTLRDLRCVMINLDPATAAQDPRVMRAAVRLNQNHAGVYATAVRAGVVRLGDRVRLI